MLRYREDVAPADIELSRIRQALFGFFGIPQDAVRRVPVDEQIRKSGFPTAGKITKAEKDAWLKAGMPNIKNFLKELRAKKNG